jgi:hypothetical protein
LRTAPVIDKNFQKRITGAEDVMSVREIQLGMQKYDPQRDAIEPFAASDDYLRTFGPKKMRKPTTGGGGRPNNDHERDYDRTQYEKKQVNAIVKFQHDRSMRNIELNASRRSGNSLDF